jgi:dTDP-4-dehydrorhamnose reductase
MRILLIGNQGQLGWELNRTLPSLGDLMALDYPEIDLAHAGQASALVGETKPHVIINAAAYTAVDQAEEKSELALAVNRDAPAELAAAARKHGAAFIHFSTDYVFDGAKGAAYVETDAPNPLNSYGASKLAGEITVREIGGAYLIFRTSWVYSLRRGSFVTKLLGWARQNSILRIVDDQISNPTWARALAETTTLTVARAGAEAPAWIRERRGLYHLANRGSVSRYTWGLAILKYDPRSQEQVATEIQPTSTSAFPAPARRPSYTALDCSLFSDTFGLYMPDWEASLRLAMDHP